MTKQPSTKQRHMKWWGWGDENTVFDISDKPEVWPFVTGKIGLQPTANKKLPIALEKIHLPKPKLNAAFIQEIAAFLADEQYQDNDYERLIHAYGKSFRDLWRVRRGIIDSAPDLIIYPNNEKEIAAIIHTAKIHNAVIIPFGGGSNIAGCVEAKDTQQRMVVSLDLCRLNKVISIDQHSQIAKIQAGVLGPYLEEQLNAQGYTLGHFPDSFQFSTLGGWVATRSAGMQSDQYGKIEDMVISLRMVTPQGMIVTRDVPRCSNGININHLCIGSEGIFGVITELTMSVHRLPVKKDYYGYLFPNFSAGIAAIYECSQKKCLPVMARLNDAEKTQLSFAFKTKSSLLKKIIGSGIKKYLKAVKKFDFAQCCFMVTCYEGDAQGFRRQKHLTEEIFKKHGGVSLGAGAGRSFAKGKYDFPYLRDFVMDYNIIADVSETATTWKNLLPLYERTMQAIRDAITNTGSIPWVGCHLSHNYYNGASLYFTFACLENEHLGLQQYLMIKKAAEDAFIANAASVSHHHAVGYEHLPWIVDDASAVGIYAVSGIKKQLDPQSIMNPGKIIAQKPNFSSWGLTHHAVQETENADVAS